MHFCEKKNQHLSINPGSMGRGKVYSIVCIPPPLPGYLMLHEGHKSTYYFHTVLNEANTDFLIAVDQFCPAEAENHPNQVFGK